MNPYIYSEPFEDEELEARAWAHYEKAREQGSILPESQLMEACRKIAHEDLQRLQATGDEPVPLAEEDESPASPFEG
jgi:hypothetical protein